MEGIGMKMVWLCSTVAVGLVLLTGIGCMAPKGGPEKASLPAVDLASVPDGVHEGAALYRRFTYRVATTVKQHQIVDIEILANKDSRHGRKAAAVVPRIIQEQRLDVDGISGATLCSTGLKQAVADSLVKAMPVE